MLNGDHAQTIDGEVSAEDARSVLEGLLRLDASELTTFMSWLESASPEERRKMAEAMSKLSEEEQKKLLALTPEQARALFASTTEPHPPKRSESDGVLHSLTSALRGINERLEKRKGAS